MSRYQQLHSGSQNPGGQMPAFPPAYDDSGALENAGDVFTSGPPIEQFEIDEDEVYEPPKRESLVKRAFFATRTFVYTFKDNFGVPLSRYLDPVYEGYNYFNMKYELSILKLGNPLVVKRLIYVLFVIVLMYLVTRSENSDGVNGASGGAFSTGKFYDVDMLADTMKQYIEAASLKENIEYLSSMPHMAGTTGDLAMVRYVETYFHNNGVQQVDFHELDSFLNYPDKEGTYVKLSDGSFSATLSEGSDKNMQNLAFNPTSPSTNGEIDARYVYVNYGEMEDFGRLDKAGVSVKDAILLIRYGGVTPESNKVYAATQLGAKAVIFISPTIEWAGEKHDDMIQRVNVGHTRVCYGDVLTPGWSSHSIGSANWEKSEITAKIPTIPISWKDGEVLVKKLGNSGADFGEGRFSGDGAVSLKLNILNKKRNTHVIWNVVGSISGREQAGKGIIFGAARDSLGYGASTSASGTATLLELVKVFTSLQRRYDWYPSRSIYFVSFDATEYNLAGSGEWLEEKRKQLFEGGYAYIDVSEIATGDLLTILTNPMFLSTIREELRKISLTEEQKKQKSNMATLYDLYKFQHGDKDIFSNNLVEYKNYIPFINRLNYPCLDVGFRGKPIPRGSTLDSFGNFVKELDSSMLEHIQIVELLARVGLRLAEDPVLPFDFIGLASDLLRYQQDLEKYVNEQISFFSSNAQVDYSKLKNALESFRQNFRQLHEFRTHWKEFIKSTSSMEPAMLAGSRKAANENMMNAAFTFLMRQDSQPSRAGYFNLLFGTPYNAPPFDDGVHEWNTFPVVRDFASTGDFRKVQIEIDRLADILITTSEEYSQVP
ncbi:CIC11C00000005947 [Sungouiella intermedia]|uniref:CIC11C00000005947 n=1 Tax=Sungouiella intermedia TaxID=45354 RepID=A0A1L0BNT7_9ASCO|nr:CIC11C00000005947 [[Candida] intermedia]